MTLILSFISQYMGFLWDGARFRITDSEVATSNGGDAWLLVESDQIAMRFVCDRQQLFLEMRPIWNKSLRDWDWFGLEVVLESVAPGTELPSLLSPSCAALLGKRILDLERIFSRGAWAETELALRRLETERAQEI